MALHSRIRDYTVEFVDCMEFLDELLARPYRVVVVDENVWAAHKTGLLEALDADAVEAIVLEVGEEHKVLATVEVLYDRIIQRDAKRTMTLVSVGGGITQDVTGFVASTLYRGIDWVFVPTTLLAQADSCIGSKTSLNYRQFKNLVGTFYPPSRVFIDTRFLSTQKEEDYASGLGEVAKLHIMGGERSAHALVAALERVAAREPDATLRAVSESLVVKQSYMEGDEFDTGRRNLLNFGHCFGHAIETATDFVIPHGQAVVVGMLVAGFLARSRGILGDDLRRFLEERLLVPTLVSGVARGIDLDGVVEAMKHDKKRVGAGLAVVMIGDGYEMMKATDVTEEEARQAMHDFLAHYGDAA